MEAGQINMPSRGAIYMVERGFKILPLVVNAKTPLEKGWQENSKRADAGTVESTYDNRNWGVHPGLTGHFVVDIDNKKGKNGSDTWAALQREHGEVPRTFTVTTPSGGLHLYFKGKVEGVNTSIGEGIDTRALNGYVVAPGSEIDGIPYRISDETPPANAPQWLVSLITPKAATVLERPAIGVVDGPGEIEKAVAFLKNAEPAVEGQNGDAQLYKTFCAVRDFGISLDTARDLVLEHYNPRCIPPWDDDDDHFEAKLRNAYNYAQNSLGARSDEATLASAVEDFKDVPLPQACTDENKALYDALEARRFDVSRVPVRTEPVLWVGDVGVAKPGDIVVVQAKVKAGKSSLLAAMMGSLMGKPDRGLDFLGFRGSNPKNFPVLHIDTEQSPEDHYDLVKRTLDRAAIENNPAWFHSYCVTDFSLKARKRALIYTAQRLFEKFGGLCAIFLDGIGDLCEDPNDGPSAVALVDEMYALAIKYACPFVNVLHENHSSETGKTRGHLGSHLERKAASNLRLEKHATTGVIQLWGERLRRGHIAKGDGPSFIWSKEKGMHVTCMGAREVGDLEADIALAAQREECEAFLSRHVQGAARILASDLNRKAGEESRTFAASARRNDQFVDKIRKLLEASVVFKIGRHEGKTGAFFVQRRMDMGFLT